MGTEMAVAFSNTFMNKVETEILSQSLFKPFIWNRYIDHNFSFSTTMALISKLHTWSLDTDGNGATVRTLLLDYRKAFDLIDHSILVRKLRNKCKLPASIINWIIDFLSDRSQRIKFESECFSEWGPVPADIPQGTKPVLHIVREICYSLCSTCLLQRSPPVLKERAGTAREKSSINNNLRKVQLGNRGGVKTHFGALSRIM